VNLCVVVNDQLDTPVIIDEYIVEEDEDEDKDESSTSSSGDSIEILTASQLNDPEAEMRVVDPTRVFTCAYSEGIGASRYFKKP
jgi:hypothetical protein